MSVEVMVGKPTGFRPTTLVVKEKEDFDFLIALLQSRALGSPENTLWGEKVAQKIFEVRTKTEGII